VNRFGDIVQKAFYLGIGAVTAAGEEAASRLPKIRSQAQKLADELVAKGEMTTDEARKLVDELIKQAQQQEQVQSSNSSQPPSEPRRIEIISDDEAPVPTNPTKPEDDIEAMRQQVKAMQEELRRLRRDS
jgi:polyhydroxyalkanoate synthesis regulator phasin